MSSSEVSSTCVDAGNTKRASPFSFALTSKADGALMQSEAYDRADRFARRFKVLSGQKTSDGLWMLKQMRIEAANPLRRTDFTPTYLEIDKPKD